MLLDQEDPRFLSSVERGLSVFEALAESSSALSLTELSKHTGLTIPTLQRITASLVSVGYLEKEESTRKYRATVHTVDLLYSFLSLNEFAKRAWPHLVRLRETVKLDVSLSVPRSAFMIYVHRLPGYRGNFENTLPGKQVPMHLSASGRCYLSSLPASELDVFLDGVAFDKLTPHSLTEKASIVNEVASCRQDGFSVVVQEAAHGVVTLACPVANGSQIVAGVSAHAPAASVDRQGLIRGVLPDLASVARAISS